MGEENALELDADAQRTRVDRFRPVAQCRDGVQHIEEPLQTRRRSAFLNQLNLVPCTTVDLNQRLAPHFWAIILL
jgi:hypothetical protein